MNYNTRKRLHELERIRGRNPTGRKLLGTVTLLTGTRKKAFEDEKGGLKYSGSLAELIDKSQKVTITEQGENNKLFSILHQIKNGPSGLTD